MPRRKLILLIVNFILVAAATQTDAIRCNRIPPDVIMPKSPVNDRYLIEIAGNPTSYTPGQKYAVTLRGNHNSEQYKFKHFILFVESEDKEYNNGNDDEKDVGRFELLNTALLRFACANAVMETSSVPKYDVEVFWVAPSSNSGCVAIRATIVISKEVWYSEDGPLSLILCEDSQDSDDVQPTVLEICCACHEAKYEVTFEGLWSRNTHPKDFPPNQYLTKFSDIIGASHSTDYEFWNDGEQASEGLKSLAENGIAKILETELKSKSDHIRTIIKARGISFPNTTGKTFAVFRVDAHHHLMSLVSMIHPSPDWFVGVSRLELCQPNCSWVESKILNLYPWDAGTDNGTTYVSEDSPIDTGEPIRKITSKSPTNSPFYDENETKMKPLARLILSRQRLYEKHNCENIDDKILNDKEYCAVTEWQEWSPCNVDCGKGTRYRQRTYEQKDADPIRQRKICNKSLTDRSPCTGLQPECRSERPPMEECELTPWGKWSACSVTCGIGIKTRSRRYKTRDAAKRCSQLYNTHPPRLEENFPCEMPPCDTNERIPPECKNRAWSEWSPCSVTCGKGTKTRKKLSINESDRHKHKRISRSYNDEFDKYMLMEDICSGVVEIVECFNDEAPSCDESAIIPALACNLPMDVGLCRSNVDRWYFNNIKGKCELFSYSGCEGNKNNFRTLEMCEHVCGGLIANRTVQKQQFEASGLLSYNMQVQNDEIRQENCPDVQSGQSVNCKVSKWSQWSHCNVSCGLGKKTKTRKILRPARNGGRPCPRLVKSKDCEKHCEKDCEYSAWTPWTPCNHSCGPSVVQQRVRQVLKEPKRKFCTDRVQIKSCDLSVCPDF